MRGGAFLIASQIVKVVSQIGAVIVLARLLPPSAFGLVAMTAALNAILDPLKELGLSSATIQKPDITHAQVSALFWINVSVGALIAVILILTAPVIAMFYHQPDLVSVTQWLALGFFVGGCGAQHWALLRRQMRLGSVAIMEASAEILGFAMAIVLALAGAGYWALVAQRLISPVLISAGGWILCRWRPSLPSRTTGVRELFAFGLSVSMTTMLGAVSRNLDQVAIGWLWGPVSLGFYERASKLMMMPLNNICIPFYSIGMPMLSRLTDQELRYRYAFGELLEKLAMITMPAAALVVVSADWITEVLFGHQWDAASPLVAWFGLVAAYYPSILAVALLYLSQNRPAELLRATSIDVCLAVLSIAVGLPFGTTGVAAALALIGVSVRLPVAFWLSTRRGPVKFRDVCMTVLPSIVAGVVVAALVWTARQVVIQPTTPAAIGLVYSVALAMVGAGVTFWLIPRSRQALIKLLRVPKLLFRAEQPAGS